MAADCVQVITSVLNGKGSAGSSYVFICNA